MRVLGNDCNVYVLLLRVIDGLVKVFFVIPAQAVIQNVLK